jgi:hypothetical protein
MSMLLDPRGVQSMPMGGFPNAGQPSIMDAPQVPQQQMQQANFGQRFKQNMGPILQALGMGIASNNLAAGTAVLPGLVDRRKEQNMQQQQMAQEQQRLNATYEWAKTQDPEVADMIAKGIIDPNTGFKLIQERRQAKTQGDEWSLSPVYGTDPDTGETVLGVTSKSGKFKKLDTDGMKVSSGVEKIDAGTHYILYDKRTGQQVGTAPKENYQEAYDKAEGSKVGGAVGEDKALYDSVSSKMPGLLKTVSELDALAETATYTKMGQGRDAFRRETGMEPSQGAIDRTDYIAKVDNVVLPMLKDTFGAAFTVAEGESLRATLGDANKSPKEKQAVLKAFITQKQRNLEALAARTGQAAPTAQKPISEMTDEELEAEYGR